MKLLSPSHSAGREQTWACLIPSHSLFTKTGIVAALLGSLSKRVCLCVCGGGGVQEREKNMALENSLTYSRTVSTGCQTRDGLTEGQQSGGAGRRLAAIHLLVSSSSVNPLLGERGSAGHRTQSKTLILRYFS